MSFEAFMQKVNAALVKKCGLPSDCLPDYDYWSAWDSGDTPNDTADDAIEWAKEF